MSTYTTQVRYICESKSGFTPEELLQKTVDEVINASRSNVFNFDFPVYDENFRSVLESTILLHFYTREIGCETVGLWQHYLCRKLREKMPYYNKLFESALLTYNPLYDVDYTRTHDGSGSGNRIGNSSRNATGTSSRTGGSNRIGKTTQANSGNASETSTGTSGMDITEGRTGTSSKTTTGTTETENTDSRTETTNSTTSKTGSRTGSKTTHDEHTQSNIHKDYYSDTPMTQTAGVNGMDVVSGGSSTSGDDTLEKNYYLTNYRKITDNQSGENDGTESQTESTTESGTGNSTTTSSGTATGSGETHGTETGNTSDNITRSENGETHGSKTVATTDNGVTDVTESTTDTDNANTTNAETGTNSESFTNADEYVEHICGKMGTASYSSMINEYRETIVNYMEMLLNDLEPLFMNIW